MIETRVRTYRTRAAYEQDLERQAQDGWVVVDVREEYARIGCLSAILAVLHWRSGAPRQHTVVTYQRDRASR
jgi:hypothetical protein